MAWWGVICEKLFSGMVYAAGGWAGVESCGMKAKGRVITVLLVDDHSLVRRALKRTLEDAADLREVGEASDGGEAFAAGRGGDGFCAAGDDGRGGDAAHSGNFAGDGSADFEHACGAELRASGAGCG